MIRSAWAAALAFAACAAPASTPCGDATCVADDVCVVERQPAACTDRSDTDGCPDGTTEAQCGGDGHPCCCAPAPAPVATCAAGCGATPSCDCVTCADGLDCNAQADGTFVCEPLPAP